MPLFKCRKCGTVENTALTACSWGQKDNPLCSECCSGKWHGKFEKKQELSDGEKDIFNPIDEDK